MTKNTVIDDAKSMASTLRSVRMTRPAEAIEKLIEAYLAQEGRIAELTKDAERLKCFNQIWRWKALKDGEIIYQYGEHVPALFQKTAELLPTHPPAPDYTDLLKMIAHRARSFPNFPLGHHITEVFAAIGEEPPEPAPAPAPELKPLSLDEIHQRYKNLRGNEPPHYIDIYRDAEAALGILRGGL